MKVTIRHIHESTGMFDFLLETETPEDKKILEILHKKHLDGGYSPGSEDTPAQLYLKGKATHG